MPFKVLIIGLGRISGIGSYKDEALTKKRVTHLGAIAGNSSFEVIGAIEKNNNCHSSYENSDFCVYDSIKSAEKLNPDLVVICSPTSTHIDYIDKVLAYWPKVFILVEKPVIVAKEDLKKLKRLQFASDQIFINFHRNVDPAIFELKSFLDAVAPSEIIGSATVGGGLIHNASHIFALFRELFGDIDEVYFSECYKKHEDYFGTIKLAYKSGPLIKISSQPEWDSIINFNLQSGSSQLTFDDDGVKIIASVRGSTQNVCSFDTQDYFNAVYNCLHEEITGNTTSLVRLSDFINAIEITVWRQRNHEI